MQSTMWPFEDNLFKVSITSGHSLAQSAQCLPCDSVALVISFSHHPASLPHSASLAPLLLKHTPLVATTGHLHLLCSSFELSSSCLLPSIHSGLCSNIRSAEMPSLIILLTIVTPSSPQLYCHPNPHLKAFCVFVCHLSALTVPAAQGLASCSVLHPGQPGQCLSYR